MKYKKLLVMKYKIYLSENRVPYLQKHLGEDKVNILKKEGEMFYIELTINNSVDLLSVFHAGVFLGMDVGK